MIELYYWPTPNGWKVSIMLEELGIPWTLVPVDIGAGDQFTEKFLAISPNHRMPAIVDRDPDPALYSEPVSVFESGAILWYLSEKTGQFMPTTPLGRKEAMEWLFWQTGNQGPMGGQYSHFRNYAPKDQAAYGLDRYRKEYERCIGVMERHLKDRDWLAGDAYSIADMLNWPWVLIAKATDVSLDPFPRVADWRARIRDRPAVQRGVNLMKDARSIERTEDQRRMLFGQTSATAEAMKRP